MVSTETDVFMVSTRVLAQSSEPRDAGIAQRVTEREQSATIAGTDKNIDTSTDCVKDSDDRNRITHSRVEQCHHQQPRPVEPQVTRRGIRGGRPLANLHFRFRNNNIIKVELPDRSEEMSVSERTTS